MTREETYQSIYTHDTIYLPPVEEHSTALEVALGCSWGNCRFCDFAKDNFQVHSIEKVEHNLKVLAELRPETTRLFLLGENAFVLNFNTLCDIFTLSKKYLSHLKSFAMYARIDDILCKSSEDLARLKAMGLSALHIGVESGSDPILLEMNKGITAAQTLEALQFLDKIDISYYVTVILGLGGRTLSRSHAIETARLLNLVHPKDIWCLKLKLWEGTPLYREASRGLFDMMTPEEMLLEEKLMLENLTVKDCFFVDTTVLDKYTIQGMLPEQKPMLLQAICQLLGTG